MLIVLRILFRLLLALLLACLPAEQYLKACLRIRMTLRRTNLLQGIGVGDEKSHPTTALLLSVFQESFGRIVTIIFAHRLGSALEPECKMYRFLADIFNDAAIILDCLSPAFPKRTRVVIFSGASMLRALCGVAAGSAKASLSAHFAKAGNLGDVNAVSVLNCFFRYISDG
jgi:hypothetical protein